MLSLIQLPLSVAVLAFALAPAVESTVTSQRWIPRKGKMDTMVVDLGGNRFSPSGSQCRLQGTYSWTRTLTTTSYLAGQETNKYGL